MGRREALTDHQWAARVMGIINGGTPRLGAWSEVDRDVILRALVRQRANPSDSFELIVDDGRANWRLKTRRGGGPGVRLADYRMSQIGRPEDPVVAQINDRLAELGDGNRP